MSQYGTIYKSEWLMEDETNEVQVYIYDTENMIPDGDTPITYDLEPTGQPLVVSVINNGRSKYGIFSKQARIEFYSTQTINAYTFADSTDQRWYVEVKMNDTTFIFKGFLVLSEIQRSFQPNPTVVSLTASDNLALLKERPLKTDADEVPTGKNRLADYILWCLKKTGLSLPFNVINNIRPGTGTASIAFANFSSTGYIFFPFPADYHPEFYIGQRLLCTSSGSNNGTVFTVVDNSSGTFSGGNIEVTPAPVHESGITNFTLTDQATGHLYDKMYVDAKTFEAEIGECEDCRTVLEKILDKNCFITQYLGEWWIINPDELNDLTRYITEYDADGAITGTSTATGQTSIGAGQNSYWISRSSLVEYDRPFKFTKHTFRYEYPKEIPCNVDFSRGDERPGGTALEKTYDVECWTLRRGYPGGYQTTSIDPYIIKRYNQWAREDERYLVIPDSTTYTYKEYLESEPIQIIENDRIDISFDWRLASTTGFIIQSVHLLQVVLHGDDGEYYFLGGDNTVDDPVFVPGESLYKWYDTSNFTANTAAGEIQLNWPLVDELEWNSFTWEAPPAPVGGNIYIWLHNFKQGSSSDYDKDLNYTNIRVEYIPYINGSYTKYEGQYSKAERTDTGFSANLDEDVDISDSPIPLVKGGMFANHSGTYVLQPVFWSAQLWSLGQPNDSDYFQPFEYHRVNGTYNQNHYCIRYFSGQLKGLTDTWPDMNTVYLISDADFDSSNKYFMLIEIEQDFKSRVWRGKFAETYRESGKVFPPFEFKYIT